VATSPANTSAAMARKAPTGAAKDLSLVIVVDTPSGRAALVQPLSPCARAAAYL
jgi:hypothetical protein